MSKEKVAFKIHPRALQLIIRSQAGSVSKAILELAQNSADADATEIDIVFKEGAVVVSDNGKGFTSKAQLKRCFSVFAQPQDDTEQDKLYGTFRCGRGQAFNFGKNIWRSNKYEMRVDVQETLDSFDLTVMSRKQPGCEVSIQLYDPLDYYTYNSELDKVRLFLRFMPLQVRLNGEVISQHVDEIEWDEETPQAYIKTDKNSSQLAVYNNGVFVSNVYSGQYGFGGLVVSKGRIEVNFARNDIIESCPVWTQIKETLNKLSTTILNSTKSYNASQRAAIVGRFRSGDYAYETIRDLNIIPLVNGNLTSLSKLVFDYDADRFPVTYTSHDSNRGDLLQRQGVAAVLSDSIATLFGQRDVPFTMQFIREKSHGHKDYDVWKDFELSDFESIAGKHKSESEVWLDTKKYTLVQRFNHRLCMSLFYYLRRAAYFPTGRRRLLTRRFECRQLYLGESTDSLAWTDGQVFIAMDHRYVGKNCGSADGLSRLASTILHEMCHLDGVTSQDHDHDQAFFERYHDWSEHLASSVAKTLISAPSIAKRLGKAPPKKLTRDEQSLKYVWALQKFGEAADKAFRPDSEEALKDLTDWLCPSPLAATLEGNGEFAVTATGTL